MDVDDDLTLLQRWREGDQSAGERLCSRHFAEIYRFFEHKIPGEADDLVQETFLACVGARDQFRGHSSFRTYLFTIARNELYARLHRLSKRAEVDLNQSSLNELVSSPADKLDRHQEQAQIRAALRLLAVEQQILLELHYWHNLDASALAELFGLNPGAIRVRLVRARQALRTQLGTQAFDPAADDGLSRSLRSLDVEEPEPIVPE